MYQFLHAQDFVFLEDTPKEKHYEISGQKKNTTKIGAKFIS